VLRDSRSAFAINPACGNPYIPLKAIIYTDPDDVAFSRRLYSLIISSGMSLSLILMSSA
jgi:hypothetical protein